MVYYVIGYGYVRILGNHQQDELSFIYLPDSSEMKKIILVLLITLSFSTAKAQSGLTHIDTTCVWSIMTSGWGFMTSYYFIQGDTVLNGQHWKKIYNCYQDSTLSNPSFTCGIREENGRVFISNGMFTNDSLVYDHNLEVGDSVQVCMGYKVVDTVDYVLIDGLSRKRIVFADPWGGWHKEIWLEGIGSNSGLPYALTYGCLFDIAFDLLCVHKDGNLIFDNPMFDGCFISNVGIEEINSSVVFYPNPLTDISELKILNSNSVFQSLIIIDVSGRIIREIPVIANKARVDKSGLKNGLYFYYIKNESQALRGRFVVQ